MKKIGAILFILTTLIMGAAAQDYDPATVTTANSEITEVRLNGFEDSSFWICKMPIDQGIISSMSRNGRPLDLSGDAYAERDERYGIPRTYSTSRVLGVKVEYISRGYNWFSIKPTKPIMIEGITQSISFWVAGRNYSHWLKIMIKNFHGEDRILYVDKLNFIGWKELKISIPENIVQRDFHFVDKLGIKFNGFIVECDPVETYGSYFVYFDELRAVTDVFNEKTRDVDDMRDDW